ncbi:hypothetical protein H311_01702 [Anncaliia algerae PRA109]|nr:hypothetical protein H311_01702 [Anncaliia algerae PRA109]
MHKHTIRKIIITNKIGINIVKKKTLKIFDCRIEDNIVVKDPKLFLQIKNYELIQFKSEFYRINDKYKIIAHVHKESLRNKNDLEKNLLKKNYKIHLILLLMLFNVKYFVILFTDLSINVISYLNDTPFGLKQNTLLKNYFSLFFLIMLKLQLNLLKNIPKMLPYKIFLLHLIIYHNVMTKLYYITYRVIVDCIYIFRGRNYNKLKKRTDRIIYSEDVIILGSFLFVFALLFMYTIIGFYLFALFFRIVFLFFNLFFDILIIYFTTDFSNYGTLIKERNNKNNKIIEFKTKKFTNFDKICLVTKIALNKSKIPHSFLVKIFTEDYQIELL